MKNPLAFLCLFPYLISLATSFSNLPMGSNSSETKLQERQNPIVHCGDKTIFQLKRTF